MCIIGLSDRVGLKRSFTGILTSHPIFYFFPFKFLDPLRASQFEFKLCGEQYYKFWIVHPITVPRMVASSKILIKQNKAGAPSRAGSMRSLSMSPFIGLTQCKIKSY